MLQAVVRWSLARPLLIAVACLSFLVWGIAYVRDIPFDLFPATAPAQTVVQTEAPGLVAEQVENLVTRPIENALLGAPGVAQVRSKSVEGLSVVEVQFAEEAQAARTRLAISERLTSLAGALPAVAGPPRIAPLTAPGEVLKIGFTSGKLDALALRDLVQWTIRPRLLATAGVSRVSVYGGQTRRIEVHARPADLSDSDLGFLDILNAVRRVTGVAGAGFIDTPSQRVLIEARGQALTKEDVMAGQIQTPSAAPVRIGDVAEVVEAAAPSFGDALIDGRPGVLVAVDRQFGANTLDVTHAVEAELAALRPVLEGSGVRVDTGLDRPATFTTTAIRGIAVDLAIGAALIALLIALFMRDWRAVGIALVAIPLSLLAALAVLKAMGWTLDSMTLGGLIVSLGIVIDDAVVGVEAVLAHLREADRDHASDREAILNAYLEVRRPLAASGLAVVVAVSPLMFLKGLQGALLAPLAATVSVAALTSLVLATTMTPALCLLLHRHDRRPLQPRFLLALERRYELALNRLCQAPRGLLLAAGMFLAVAVVALALQRPQLVPPVHDAHLVAEVAAPPSTSLAVMHDYGAGLSQALEKIAGVKAVSQTIGRDPTGADSWGSDHAVFDIALSPDLSAGAQERVARDVAKAFTALPGLTVTTASRFDALQKQARAGAPVQLRLFGQNVDALDGAADRAVDKLRTLPGANDVHREAGAFGPVMRIDLNFPRLALYGLSAADVLETVRAAFAGQTVAQIYQNDRAIDVAVSAQDTLRQDPEGVGELLLRSNSGVSVPLRTVANVYLTDGRVLIAHDGGLRRQVVTADPKNPQAFVQAARKALAGVAMPPGGFIEFGGSALLADQSGRTLILNLGLAALVAAGVLTVAFNGRVAAFSLVSTLFAFLGGAAASLLLGGALSVGVIAGFVALFGISLRNAILLFGWLGEKVRRPATGHTLDAVVLGSRKRMAPLLLTVLLVAVGVAPLAVDAGRAGREILGPMAIVTLGGLFTGALADLFLLPPMILALWRVRPGGPAATAKPEAA